MQSAQTILLKKTLSKNILLRRKELKISQAKLAEMLNIDNVTVSRLETGKNLPSIQLLIQISQILNINISDLISSENIHSKKNNFDQFSINLNNLDDIEINLLLKVTNLFIDHIKILRSNNIKETSFICNGCGKRNG